MKYIAHIITFILSIAVYNYTCAATKPGHSFYEQLKDQDLSDVINPDSITNDLNETFERPQPLGFIGPSFQRFYIHFSTFKKSSKDPFEYIVTGKTKVNNHICSFSGTVTIITATYDTVGFMEDIGFPEYKGGTITSKVLLYENKSVSGSGSIQGTLTTQMYFDNHGKLFYEALSFISDGFANNQFEGTWTSYATGRSKKCNWGDYRIPDSGDLDTGTGEFAVSEKYVSNGWQNYRSAYHADPDAPETIAALQKETEQWWK